MSEIRFPKPPPSEFAIPTVDQPAAAPEHCDECLGSGGWYRYEPALDPLPGLLYLSCLHCRGSGRTALARA